MNYLSDLVRERLQLKEGVTTTEGRLLDIGGGTGNFTCMIMEDTELVAVAVIDHHLEHQNERVRNHTINLFLGGEENIIRFC